MSSTKFKSKTKDDSGAEDIDSYSEIESIASNTPIELEKAKLLNLTLGAGVKKILLQRIPATSASKLLVPKKKTTKFLVDDAIAKLAEPKGSSLIAIKKYITANNTENVTVRLNGLIKRYIKKAVEEGKIIQHKGHFQLAKVIIKKPKAKRKTKVTKEKSETTKKVIKAAEKSSMKDANNDKVAKGLDLAKAVINKVANNKEIKKKITQKKELNKDHNSKSKPKAKRKSIVTVKTTMTATKTQMENKKKLKATKNKKAAIQPEESRTEKVPKNKDPAKEQNKNKTQLKSKQ